MSEDGKYWISFWGLAALVVITLIVSITTYNYHVSQYTYQVVKASPNPQAAECAMKGDHTSPVCLVLAAKQNSSAAK